MKKIALITGGTRGIGKAIVTALLDAGYSVHFTYHVSHEEAKKIVTENSGKCFAHSVDSNNTDAMLTFTQKFLSDNSPYLLVNNIGINQDKLFIEQTLENFWEIFHLNFGSVLTYSKAILPAMMKQRNGQIINISSVAAGKPKIGNSAYGVSKLAIERLSKTLALEAARFNVRVNCISPGFVQTELLENYLKHKDNKKFYEQIPMRKILLPEDIANLVVNLSNGSINTTGSILQIGNGENIF